MEYFQLGDVGWDGELVIDEVSPSFLGFLSVHGVCFDGLVFLYFFVDQTFYLGDFLVGWFSV